MTATELNAHCTKFTEEHGLMQSLEVLEHIIECLAQSAGVELLDMEDLDEIETRYSTAH